MSDYRTVYREHPERYDELVRAEDVDASLLTSLQNLVSLRGAQVVEAGAGTGRITRMLLEAGARHVLATEIEPAMLAMAQTQLSCHGERVRVAVADARALPAKAASADYQFDSVADAARVTGFFFGEAFAARVLERQWRRVPECTGVWSLTRP